jgi:hypothetical protein
MLNHKYNNSNNQHLHGKSTGTEHKRDTSQFSMVLYQIKVESDTSEMNSV